MDFTKFCEITRDAIARGEIVLTTELTDLDLAIQYAIGKEMEERGRGGEFVVTVEEIYYLIGKHCGEAVRNRLLPD